MSQAAKQYQFPPRPPDMAVAEPGKENFPDDWYLVPYQTMSPEPMVKRKKRVLLAAVAVCLGAGILTCCAQYFNQTASVEQQSQVTQRAASSTAASRSADTPGLTAPVADSLAKEESASRRQDLNTSTPGPPSDIKPTPSSDDLARLKTRNRRLEALVKVLRHRDVDSERVTYGADSVRQ